MTDLQKDLDDAHKDAYDNAPIQDDDVDEFDADDAGLELDEGDDVLAIEDADEDEDDDFFDDEDEDAEDE